MPGKIIGLDNKCPGCDKPRAEPLSHCLDHFAEHMAELYQTAPLKGIRLPLWSHTDPDFYVIEERKGVGE